DIIEAGLAGGKTPDRRGCGVAIRTGRAFAAAEGVAEGLVARVRAAVARHGGGADRAPLARGRKPVALAAALREPARVVLGHREAHADDRMAIGLLVTRILPRTLLRTAEERLAIAAGRRITEARLPPVAPVRAEFT